MSSTTETEEDSPSAMELLGKRIECRIARCFNSIFSNEVCACETCMWNHLVRRFFPTLSKPLQEQSKVTAPKSSKTTADGDCSHEIKRRLLLGRKAMTSPDSILKSRDIHYFANIGLSSHGYGFASSHVWM